MRDGGKQEPAEQRRAAHVRAVLAAALGSLALFGTPPAHAANEEETRIAGIVVTVWTSPDATTGTHPVVVFSHGMYMCPTQSRFLTRALADAGYIVIAPRHADSNCEFSVGISDLSRYALKPSLLWSDSDYRDRGDDIRRVVTALRHDPRFRDRADPERLALVGHSLGGYTVLGLGGAWPSWRLPEVKAILALSPYSLPFYRSDGLSRLKAPVMYQTGSWDAVFALPLQSWGDGYGQSPRPKYLVEIDGAAHLAWTDLGTAGREAIVGHAIAFFDHHVKGAPAGAALRIKLPGVARFEHDG